MKELFEQLEETNNQIANNIEKLGWFLYEVSNQEGDHSKAIHALIALKPEFPEEGENLLQDVLRILDIDEVAFNPANNSEEPTTENVTEERYQSDEQIRDNELEPNKVEEEVVFEYPNRGVIKVFNEPNFKLAICSRDVSKDFLSYAEERKCPVEILEHVTQERLLDLEQKCRQQQNLVNKLHVANPFITAKAKSKV